MTHQNIDYSSVEVLAHTIWSLWKKNSDCTVSLSLSLTHVCVQARWRWSGRSLCDAFKCFQLWIGGRNTSQQHNQTSKNWEPNWTGGDTQRLNPDLNSEDFSHRVCEARRLHTEQTVILFVCSCRLQHTLNSRRWWRDRSRHDTSAHSICHQ